MIKYFALVILSISFFFMTGCNNTSKSGLEESQHTVTSQGMAEYVEDERETLELPDDSNYITQSSDVDFDGDGIADHLYIKKIEWMKKGTYIIFPFITVTWRESCHEGKL